MRRGPAGRWIEQAHSRDSPTRTAWCRKWWGTGDALAPATGVWWELHDKFRGDDDTGCGLHRPAL